MIINQNQLMIQNLAILATMGLIALVAKVSCNVYEKAGFPKYFGLLLLLPIINLLALYALAFGDWPIHKKLME
jgi:hypothetical protein